MISTEATNNLTNSNNMLINMKTKKYPNKNLLIKPVIEDIQVENMPDTFIQLKTKEINKKKFTFNTEEDSSEPKEIPEKSIQMKGKILNNQNSKNNQKKEENLQVKEIKEDNTVKEIQDRLIKLKSRKLPEKYLKDLKDTI